MTATLTSPMDAEIANRSSWPSSEEDVYVAVARAWCRLFSWEERREHPLGPYVLGGRFVRSVADAPVEGGLVVLVCARLACRYPWERDSGESLPLSYPPVQGFDPLSVWWRALGDPDGFGVFYDELGSGTLEFLAVARRADRLDGGFSGV